jgi:hypothetical protein
LPNIQISKIHDFYRYALCEIRFTFHIHSDASYARPMSLR